MKKTLLTLCVAMVGVFSVTANEVKPFSEIQINAQTRVMVLQGPTYQVEVLASDTITKGSLKYEVEGDVLKLKSDEKITNTVVIITTPEGNNTPIKIGKWFQAVEKK